MNNIAIECKQLTRSYPVIGEDGRPSTLNVLRDINFRVERGSFVTIEGPSGSGKSTLMRIIGMLEVPSSGTLQVNDKWIDCAKTSDAELAVLRNRYVGFIFQSHRLMNDMSAIENIMLPVLIRGMSMKEARQKAQETLAEFFSPTEIAGGVALRRPSKLSGGQKQRVAAARAVIGSPEIILADEPTGSLDHENALHVIALLRDLQQKRGLTIVMVTHNPEHAQNVDRRFRLRDGKLITDHEQPSGSSREEVEESHTQSPHCLNANRGIFDNLRSALEEH